MGEFIKALHAFREAARNAAAQEALMVETACEKSVQGGKHGVLVTRDPNGLTVSATISEQVPYGEIHYRQDWL